MLLDISVLMALFDSDHVDHARVRRCAEAEIVSGWASCAITQNGFVRIISQPRYPSHVAPAQAIDRLARAAATELHKHWPCTISLLGGELFDYSRLHGHRQVTDVYLLDLATAQGGRFITLDHSVSWVRCAAPPKKT